MGLWNKIKKGMIRKSDKDMEIIESKLPFDLRVGGVLALNSLDFRLLGANTNVAIPEDMSTMIIVAYGKIELDFATTIHRFYTDTDDTFFQVTEEDGIPTDLLFFAPHDTVHPVNEDDWNFWKNELIGDVAFETKDGIVYDRAAAEDYDEPIDPFEFEEHIIEKDGDKVLIEHTMMLYARWIQEDSEDEDDGIIEWLYVSIEDAGETAEVALYLGLNVDPTIIEVT